MERIYLKDYHASMGILVDISDPEDYHDNKTIGSINIPYNKLLYHHRELLNKDNKYYFCCLKGVKSKKIAGILDAYGYNVGYILKE